MAKSSVFSRPKVNRSTPRNAFDRSSIMTFNGSAGMLLPLKWWQCTAGTRFKVNENSFIRTADVNTAAFPAIDFNVELYKVPLRLLWSYWNDFKLGIQDLNSSALIPETNRTAFPSAVPSVDLNSLELEFLRACQNDSNTVPTDTDSLGFVFMNGFYRLRDLLNYGGDNYERLADSVHSAWRVNLFPIAAYQKIYFDHKRNTAYETNNPFAYNFDWLGVNNYFDATDSAQRNVLHDMFSLRYVNMRNDYYRNVYPSLNFVSSVPTSSIVNLPSSVVGGFSNLSSLAVVPNNNSVLATGGTYSTEPSVSVQSIRAAFALDKLLRASAYAPKHVKEQFAARFGVKMSDKVSNESEYIGSFNEKVKFLEVTATATTMMGSGNTQVASSLGEIGGKGLGGGSQNRTIETYCEEDCIIMAVGYFIPRSQSDAYGCDEWLTKLNKEQFFQPEFENLGLEPVYYWESHRANGPSVAPNNYIVGYRPRNQVYKADKDLNHGQFKVTNIELMRSGNTYAPASRSSNLSAFTLHTDPIQPASSGGVSYMYFKCNPMMLNPIFVTQYSRFGAPIDDQFFGQIQFNVSSVQDMSVHGLPSL